MNNTSERPALAEVDRLRLELAIARLECAQLQAGQARQVLEAVCQGLTRDGYTLIRNGAGEWGYEPAATEAGGPRRLENGIRLAAPINS